MLKKIVLFYFLFLTSFIFSQNMQEGFNYLETGKYPEAKLFFENILENYPNNKTAKLCYGRAVGLAGDSGKAVLIFTQLRKRYPSDFEIKLNYAESLLWNKQYNKAEGFYEKLVVENDKSFPAILGYANTLSNLKKYPEALNFVNTALSILEENPNALISRKYIRLGYAFQLSQDKQYQKALNLLDLNLKDFPNDKSTQLNRANIFLVQNEIDKAEIVYKSLATSAKDSIVALNGLSLTAHKKHKNKEALKISKQATEKAVKFSEDNELNLTTKERYIQALLWNKKFKLATLNINGLKKLFPNNSRIESLEAAKGMYTSDFNKSISKYTSILKKDKKSFDGNLGITNAYRATGQDLKSYEYAFKTLKYYKKQPDAEKLLKAMKLSHTPWVEHKTTYTFDNGDNESISFLLATEVPISVKAIFKANYVYRDTENTRSKVNANTNQFDLGLLYKFNGRFILDSKIGVTVSNAFSTDYTQWIGEIRLKTKPFKLQNLDFGYQRELQNFNADLIDREIVMNHFFLNYNLNTNFNLGWYTQYMFTRQSDNNIRNLLFTSLYYKILRRPIVKAGINYQNIVFKDQLPLIYFSPSKFHVIEFFAEVLNIQKSKWIYLLSAAGGYQFVNEDPASEIFRIEAKLGYEFSDRFSANIYGKHSNIASATAAGFEFTELGFKVKWYFLRKPLFNKKIMALQHR